MAYKIKFPLSLFKRNGTEEKLCIYKAKHTKNQKSILINCRDCDSDSTLNNETCRRNIFSILLAEPLVDRIVLSHLYERDYEGSDLKLLYSFARFQDYLNSYSSVEVAADDCTHSMRQKCVDIRKELIDSIIETARKDPIKAYHTLMQPLDTTGLRPIDRSDDPGCINCIDVLITIFDEMRDMASGLKSSFTNLDFDLNLNLNHNHNHNHNLDTTTFDYDKYVKSHVRPAFSTSRIYTEPPENTTFLECYDVRHNDGRSLEVSIYALTDRPEKLYVITPLEYNLKPLELKLIERVRKKMIRHRPADLNFADPSNSREYFRRMGKKMLVDDAKVHNIALTPFQINTYSDLLAKYTTGLGILEDLLSDERVTDVYINAPADLNPVYVVMDGDECATNVFLSQDDLDSMVSRFRAISGRPFGEATPVLEMELKEYGVRVSVIGDPLSANGLAYAFRKHSRTPWTLPRLINTGSISPLAAGLLSFLMDGQSSVLVAGDVGAGKTSLLCAMLLEIPQKYRILTIEDTREIPISDLQQLGWKVQGMNSQSAIIKSGVEIAPDVALRAALRLGNSSLVIGEVRGPEVAVLYEAMQIGTAGNSVIGTIHGASTKAVYERIVYTLGVPSASFKSTDAVVVCSNTRLGGGMTKTKRVVQVSEVNSTWDEGADYTEVFSDILSFDASIDSLVSTEILDRGQSELIGKVARKWGISIDAASRNIRMRAKIKGKMAEAGLINPALVEANVVSTSNNMFWLFMDDEKNNSNGPDYQNVYNRWSEWFDDFSSGYITSSK
ncbi:MAG: type II/IV secretion system ATPase subunit [Methanosarcinaceae archaeon]|nr:type II/IV secretion system ATPase subunit [Methanosarcinaceae archaeon]